VARSLIDGRATISRDSSGGPAFDIKGEVVGLALMSASLEGDQAIQGFNFLIPIDTIHAMAKQIGMTPSTDSPFTREWDQTIAAAIEGKYRRALTHAKAADKLVPRLIDVRRIIVRPCGMLEEKP